MRNITRNVSEEHLSEIFNYYAKVKSVSLQISQRLRTKNDYALIEFETMDEAEKA